MFRGRIEVDWTIERMERRLLIRLYGSEPFHNELLDILRETHIIRLDMVKRGYQFLHGRLTGTYPSPPPYLKLKSFSSRDESGMSHVIG